MEKIMNEWNDFLNWCEVKGLKPGNGQVLRTYVKTLREGKWDYV